MPLKAVAANSLIVLENRWTDNEKNNRDTSIYFIFDVPLESVATIGQALGFKELYRIGFSL